MIELYKWYKEVDTYYLIFNTHTFAKNGFQFCKDFNEWTIDKKMLTLPAIDLQNNKPIELDNLNFTHLFKYVIMDLFKDGSDYDV